MIRQKKFTRTDISYWYNIRKQHFNIVVFLLSIDASVVILQPLTEYKLAVSTGSLPTSSVECIVNTNDGRTKTGPTLCNNIYFEYLGAGPYTLGSTVRDSYGNTLSAATSVSNRCHHTPFSEYIFTTVEFYHHAIYNYFFKYFYITIISLNYSMIKRFLSTLQKYCTCT